MIDAAKIIAKMEADRRDAAASIARVPRRAR
jgi:hypothetical protein